MGLLTETGVSVGAAAGVMLLLCSLQSTPVEFLFPLHCVYYLATFVLSYPDGGKLRLGVVGFLLCFGDLAVSSLYGLLLTSSKLQLFVLMYVILLMLIYLSKIEEVYDYGKNPVIRGTVFVCEGLFKAELLTATMCLIVQGGLGQGTMIEGVLFGVAKFIVGPLVQFANSLLCSDRSLRELDYSGFVVYGKAGAVLSGLAILTVCIEKCTFTDDFMNRPMSYSRVIIDMLVMTWYVKDSLEYGRYFHSNQ